MGASLNFYTKKAHRYLGVFIGIQFLFWTIGGLYFSWTNIGEIRGEHLRRPASGLKIEGEFAAPSVPLARLAEKGAIRSVEGVSLSQVLGETYYSIEFVNGEGRLATVLASARTGDIRESISKDEAVEIASREISGTSKVLSTELLTRDDVGGHHEYREKPLPAYAITYAEPAGTIVYVSQQAGRVESVRTSAWRVFDFFWLFHTLDFYGRDNINNYVLRAFSVLGLVTLFSGYLLFFITSPWFKRGRKNRRAG